MLGRICAVEEFSVEELDANHGEDEQEQDVDDENVEHIFQRGYNTVKHSLECRNTVDHLQGSKDTQELHRFQLLASGSAPGKQAHHMY